jgi:phosphoserine phosphatase RsbU/P
MDGALLVETGSTAPALHRSQQLLQVSDQLSVTVTTADVLATVPALLRHVLGATHAEVSVAGSTLNLGHGFTSAVATALTAPVRREGLTRFYANRTELTAARPALAADVERLGWQAAVCAPLSGASGTLLLAWPQPHVFSADDRAHLARLVDYIVRALQRARRHDGWRAAAEALQGAAGSQLPRVDGYEIAGHYLSAEAHPTIGGDWYDAIPGRRGRLALIIGDVVGHGLVAAAGMGRLRSMLRAYLMDGVGSPSVLLRRLEAANHALGEPTMATAVVAFVEPTANGGHRLRWANAGHPPPVIIGTDGEVRALTGHDLLLGVRRSAPRHTYVYSLPAGATVLLHTDGLVERCGQPIDDNLAQLYRSLRTGGRPKELLATAFGVFAQAHSDDVAMLAVRIPG